MCIYKIITFMLFIVFGNALYEGDLCFTRYNTIGECRLVTQCPSSIKLITNMTVREIPKQFERCGFDEFTEIICCPEVTPRYPYNILLYKGDPCITREQINGECRLVTECPSTVLFIQNAALRDIRKTFKRCGFERFTEIVCCPEKSITNKI